MDEVAARNAFEQALGSYEQDFGKFFLARLFGMDFQYPGDTCTVSFEVKEFMHNPQGGLHGGVIAFALDIAMGHLLRERSGAGTTLEMKVQYLSVAKSGRLTATGRFLKKGRRISYLRADLTDGQGGLIAFATSTWLALNQSQVQSHKPQD
ncbi:MAG TPA: PaaI family thioesterase [Phycisphaerales bacterium]|nr:PaaI family thioesterase [Phycisphaerales bacterium]